MKQAFRYLIFGLSFFLFLSGQILHAQTCAVRGAFGSLVPTSNWQTINYGRGGEAQIMLADSGCTYQFSYCVTDGGYAPFDTEITIYDNILFQYAGGYNDDAAGCGTGSKLTWTAPRTGEYRIQTNKKPCTTDTRLVTLAFRKVSCPPPPCNRAEMQVCIFDAPGGLDNCIFVGDLCSDGFQFGVGTQTSAPFQINELQTLDSIKFKIYTTGCPPGATQGFYFYLNNQLIGTLPLGSNDCLCAAVDYPRTVVFTGAQLMTAWNFCGLNTLGINANNDPNYAITGYVGRLYYTNKPVGPPAIIPGTQYCGPTQLFVPPAPCNQQYYWQTSGCDSSRSFPAVVPYTALTAGTYRVRIENAGLQGCWSDTCSAYQVITPVLGNVLSGNQTICAGTQPALLSGGILSGGTGLYTYSWVSSTDSINWANIPGATQDVFQPGIPTQAIWFRRLVLSGCSSLSPPVKISMEQNIQGNTITSSQTLCQQNIPAMLSGSLPVGGSIPLTWQWIQSADSLLWSAIPGATQRNYQPPQINTLTWISRITYGGVCRPDTSLSVRIYPEPLIGNNQVLSAQTICAGSQPAVLSGTLPSGGNLSYQYQWQESTNHTNWINLNGGTLQNFSPPVLNTIRYYRRVITSGLCPAATSQSIEVYIEFPLAGNLIGSDQTLCENVQGSMLTGAVPTGGTGLYGFVWESSATGSNWLSTGIQNSALQVQGMSSNVYYRRVVSSGICPALTSLPVLIRSVPAIQGNMLGAGQTLCHTGAPGSLGTLFPSGGNGVFVYQWESSVNGNAWINISGATQSAYTEGPLNSSVYYRRIVHSDVCRDTSAAQYWQVNQVITQNMLSADQTVCGAQIPALVTGPVPQGTGGGVVYQWEQSTNQVQWNLIPGETTSAYQPSVILQTTWYRRVLFSTVCVPLTSNAVQITLLPGIGQNQIFADQTVCTSNLPGLLTGTLPSGGTGVYTYTWEQSIDLQNWSIPSGAVNINYQPPVLSGIQYFRRNVFTGFCASAQSNIIQILAEERIGNNLIGNSQTICAGSLIQALSGSQPSGGSGLYAYTWQSSINQVVWNTAGNTQNFNPVNLNQQAWFRRVVTAGACLADTSAQVRIFIQQPLSQNIVGSSQTICETQTPVLFTGSVPSGGDGNYFYQWESSINNTNWLALSGVFQQDYQAPQVLQSVYYRRIAYSGLCPASTSASVWVRTDRLIGNNQLNSDQTLCAGSQAAVINGTLPTGGTFSFVYLWQSSPDQISWNTASGISNVQSYTPGSPPVSVWYRRIVQSGVCAPLTSNQIHIAVLPIVSGNLLRGAQTLCAGSVPARITGAIPSGADGNFTYSWQVSTDGINWTNAPGVQNQPDYLPVGFTGEKYFRRLVQNPVCGMSYSNIIQIRSDAPISAGSVSADQLLCAGQVPSVLSGSSPSGGISLYQYRWESGTDGVQWSLADTQSVYQPGQIFQTTYFRRIIQSGACPAHTSNTLILEVQQAITGNIIMNSQTLCAGMQVTPLSGSIPSGGSGTYIFIWESSTNLVQWIQAGSQQDFSPGFTQQNIYVRRIVQSGICPQDTSAYVYIEMQPLIGGNIISGAQTLCGGQIPAVLTGNLPLGGSGMYAYQWQYSSGNGIWTDIPGGFLSDYQPPVLFASALYRRIVSSGACASIISAPLLIQITPKPALTVNSDTICAGSSVRITAVTDIPGGTYLWTPGNDTTSSILVSPLQTSGYTVSYTAGGCIADPAGAVISVVPSPPADITYPGSDIICVGDSKLLTVNINGGPYTYLWNTGQTDQTLLTPGPGYYHVKVKDMYGCESADTVHIRYASPPLSVSAPAVQGVCVENQQQQINVVPVGGVPPYTVVWSPSAGLSDPFVFSPLTIVNGPATYTATVRDQTGCTGQASVTVGLTPIVHADFKIEALKGDTLYFPDSVKLVNLSLNPLDCTWDLGIDNKSHICSPPAYALVNEGAYEVSLWVVSPEGCRDSVSKKFWYRTEPTIYYPTAFSPNGDGVNDYFRIPGLNIRNLLVLIYDRWGNLVFTSTETGFAWDGSAGGNPVVDGIYIVRVTGDGLHGQPFEYNGTITLIR